MDALGSNRVEVTVGTAVLLRVIDGDDLASKRTVGQLDAEEVRSEHIDEKSSQHRENGAVHYRTTHSDDCPRQLGLVESESPAHVFALFGLVGLCGFIQGVLHVVGSHLDGG